MDDYHSVVSMSTIPIQIIDIAVEDVHERGLGPGCRPLLTAQPRGRLCFAAASGLFLFSL